jgi:hypothetical protein
MKLIKLIVSGIPYINYWIQTPDGAKKVIHVTEEFVTVRDRDGVETTLDREYADSRILAFKVAGNKGKIYDVCYTSYPQIALTKEEGDVLEGETVALKARAIIGNKVSICDLKVIDNMQLLPNQRLGVIKGITHNKFQVLLLNIRGNNRIELHRNQFSIVDGIDERIVFRLHCKCYDV